MLYLREYRHRPERLFDHLPWGHLVAPGVILNKDGAFMTTLAFRGPDMASSSPSILIALRQQLNHAHKQLGSKWCLHFEARRDPSPKYPGMGAFPDPISRVIDQERRNDFEGRGRFFESRYYATFTYLPAGENEAKFASLVIENAPQGGGSAGSYREELEQFQNTVNGILDSYRSVMPLARRLGDDELLTYLHSCVSTKLHLVRTPEVPAYLDAFITDDDLTTGLQPKLGDHHLKVISVRAYPKSTEPGLLDQLNDLGIAYRWVSRFLPLDKVDGVKEFTRMRRFWYQNRKNLMAVASEAVNKSESPHQNLDALARAQGAERAMAIVAGDVAAVGYYTVTVTLTDRDPAALKQKVRLVESVINNAGFTSKAETANAVEAWLGSLPGNAYPDLRRPVISTQSLADLSPVQAVWAGPDYNDHLSAECARRGHTGPQPPLMYVRTTGSTPFRLNIHQGDVGHTQVVGPTGSGKSVLLTTMALSFLRYPEARVIFFDVGASSRAATLCTGGSFYNLSAAKGQSDLTFQPLANLDNEAEIEWASGWIEDIVESQGVAITPEIREQIYLGIVSVSKTPRKLRTLTNLWIQIQDDAIKAALTPFTLQGAYGYLLDSNQNTISSSNWMAFEMGALMESKALTPALTYIFHALEALFDGRPTMLILDEAWLFIGKGSFGAKIRDWLKTLRRKNVAVIFATQSLADIADSPIASALRENCFTKIYLPNQRAKEPAIAAVYATFGLNETQLNLIAHARPKREYYFTCPDGNRLVDLGLGPFLLTIAGSNNKNDQTLMDELWKKYGSAGFREAFLRYKAPTLPDGHRQDMLAVADALASVRRAA